MLFIDDFLAYGNAAKGVIDLCRQAGATMTQYALCWALAQKGVISALIGIKREEQIREAAEALA